MKYIFISLLLISSIYGSVLKSSIQDVDNENETATIKIERIDVGMSGFVVHHFDDKHSSILKNAVVESYDSESSLAMLKLSDFTELENSALPKGKWNVKEGDTAILAFGYSRALLIAPSANIYNKITKSTKTIQWLHPDIFATLLSVNGHPTPLKEDFNEFSASTYVGLLFIFLDNKLYTVDAKSFKILSSSDVAIESGEIKLPFYSRVEEIDANWFGAGSSELEEYEPHYYELLLEYNQNNKELQDALQAYEKRINEIEE
jgi:hypothetical protein